MARGPPTSTSSVYHAIKQLWTSRQPSAAVYQRARQTCNPHAVIIFPNSQFISHTAWYASLGGGASGARMCNMASRLSQMRHSTGTAVGGLIKRGSISLVALQLQ